ncbi:MAG: aminotransferase class V-fold PLP-dependent enzyme [candidate division Zixibacteria bacterium]|nr:aminotransferase class V-fold PLP-dependent enzyme [candidate division Zixibacteria bacterium]
MPESFENQLSELLSGKIFLTNSGKTALYLILKAASEISPDKTEVIIPDYTCWSIPSAVVKAGLKVHPIDIEVENYGISPQSLKEAINKNTLAVVATHLFGIPGKINEIEKTCREKNVILIDDAAQGLGASLNDRPLGSYGDAAILSFGRGKNITTLSGGAALIRNNSISSTLEKLYANSINDASNTRFSDSLQLGIYKMLFSRYLFWIPDALPFLALGETIYNPGFDLVKLSQYRTSRGSIMMRKLNGLSISRQIKAKHYNKMLSGIDGINLARPPDNSVSVFLRFPVTLMHENIRRYIIKKGHKLGISGMYPDTVSSIPDLRLHLKDDYNLCPNAKTIAEKLVTLPTHYAINSVDIEKIAGFVRDTVEKHRL